MLKLLFAGSILLSFAATDAQAFAPQVFAPSVVASVHDEPVDGLGDTFNNSPFEGLIRVQSTRADRAIQEYDLSALAGQPIQSATLSGRVAVNNSFDNGVRTFDFVLYGGNGTADLSDYQISGTVVGSGQYHPPTDTSFTFNFDVSTEVGTLIAGGASFIGLRVEGTSSPSFPNILVTSDSMLDVVVGTAQVSSYCAGDGSGTGCPCGNVGAADSGCGNSANASGASISWSGLPSLSGTFTLSATNLIPSTPGLYFEGTAQQSGGAGALFGDGLRCAAGQVTRLQVVIASAGGASATSVHIPTVSGVSAGETRYYQLWYRDPLQLTCGTGFNLTNALAVGWGL